MGNILHGNKVRNHGVAGSEIEPRKVILLIGADPLRLHEEHRAIDREVAFAEAGHLLDVRTVDMVRIDDLQSALLRHRPAIVHFSGHGAATAGIVVNNGTQGAQAVRPEVLTRLFGILRADLHCVVLNACFTEEQARAIAVHIPCVVGMRSRVLDGTAIKFAAGFYRGIAHGGTIRQSFDLACNLLDLNEYPDGDMARLITADGYANRSVIIPIWAK